MAKKSKRPPPPPARGGRRAYRAGTTNDPNATGGKLRSPLNERLSRARASAEPTTRDRWVTVEVTNSENGNPIFIQKKDAPGHPVYRAAHLVDTKVKVLEFWSEDRGSNVRETSDRKLLTRAAAKSKVDLSAPQNQDQGGPMTAGLSANSEWQMPRTNTMGAGGRHPQAVAPDGPVAEPNEDTGVSGPRRRR